MKIYRLNRHVRYRKEEGYLLLCDCKQLTDYQLPLEYFELLELLEIGCKLNNRFIDTPRKKVIKELFDMGVVVRDGDKERKNKENVFKKLSYEESEFFK